MRRRGKRRKGPYLHIEPIALSEVVPGVLKGLRPRKGGLDRVRKVWSAVVGEPVAARTRLATLENGVLTVEVASSSLKHDLMTFRMERVLRDLKRRLPETPITSLRCRVGNPS